MLNPNSVIARGISPNTDGISEKTWKDQSRQLADFAWERIAIKRDRHGLYSTTGGASWTFSELTKDELAAHFSGEITIGCGSTSVDDKCLWIAFDFDNHSSGEATTHQNLDYAIVLMNRLAELGVQCLIEDSDGKGGIHVWVFFSQPIPSEHAHRFSKWIARDFGEHGLTDCECFPKAATVQHTEAKCGTYLRVPGKHHKREHWSRFWGDGEWLDAEGSIQLLLNAPVNSPACLAHAPKEEPASPPTEYNGPESDTQHLVQTALPYIRDDSYATWLKVGQALHSEGDQCLSDWIQWSSTSEKFKPGECEAKWQTFSAAGSVKLGTVFHLAAENGWKRPTPEAYPGINLDGILDNILPALNASDAKSITFAGIDISECELFALSEVEWIVQGIFSADQPTLFGAKSKCLKTTQLVDLAVALASGTDWLGTFQILRKRRVLFITGEANNRAISRRLAKAAKARGMSLPELTGMIRVEAVDFPKLPNIEHCAAVAKTVNRYGIEVVIVDPLYRGIPNDLDTNKMAQMGDAITNFSRWCEPASVIFSHHVTKSAARELGSPPELEDMTGAGVAESCGNWWLVGRNEKYQWNGEHDLCVSYGGRDEQSGGRRILFNENTWTAEVESLHEFISEQQEAAQRAREDSKRDKHHRAIESARARVQQILRDQETPLSKNQIEERRGEITQKAIREAIYDMSHDGTITTHEYRDSRNRLQSGGYLIANISNKHDSLFNTPEVIC